MEQTTKIEQILEHSRNEIERVVKKTQLRQCEKGYFFINLAVADDPIVSFIPKLFPMTNPIYLECKPLVENYNPEREERCCCYNKKLADIYWHSYSSTMVG